MVAMKTDWNLRIYTMSMVMVLSIFWIWLSLPMDSAKPNLTSMVMVLSTYLTLWLLQENLETERIVSEIRSLYRDEDNLLRTVTKRIYEQWNEKLEQCMTMRAR